MLAWTQGEVRDETQHIVKEGLKRGVDEIISHALRQWNVHGYGLPVDEATHHRERWLAIRKEADVMVRRLVEFLDRDR